ncbi:hypothetical protein [Bradyrhizobium sp. Tv2a-2]|uniref:hypothetical protein n=1 Tax=Bradyrhizobium sp. Tv2a-2 TaxID=113395 RepID=UPI000465BF98|nr:hypothetical protein [Bradyrhizobium sp. Tv2a-2]
MKKPTAAQFFMAYGLVWAFGIFLICVYTGTSGPLGLSILFIKMSCYNIAFVVFNLIGTMIAAATGWTPWRS